MKSKYQSERSINAEILRKKYIFEMNYWMRKKLENNCVEDFMLWKSENLKSYRLWSKPKSYTWRIIEFVVGTVDDKWAKKIANKEVSWAILPEKLFIKISFCTYLLEYWLEGI